MTSGNPWAIEAEKLKVSFRSHRGRRVEAVAGLDMRITAGEVVGFIGPNGAGKTTTIKVLMGFLLPTSGDVRVFGERPGPIATRRRIGYLPEVARYYPFLSAREALHLYASLDGIPVSQRGATVNRLLERVGLGGRADDRLAGYSKGMLQRVGIAQAIMGDPDLLLLDEVTSGLDPVARHDLRSLLMDFKERGKTVFFSSHELTEVAMLCDRILILDEGRVREENTLDEMLRESRVIVLRVSHSDSPPDTPLGVTMRGSDDGVFEYAIGNWDTATTWRKLLEEAGATVLDMREEHPSLEDYFVSKIGHKVT